ncbi:MAG: DUF58 domain-containing protein [Hyphomicrobium sp.]
MAGVMFQAGRPTGEAAELFTLERDAHGLADRLPDLLIDAKRIAATVAHGIHGRRRSGPGETFWQFRQFQSNDGAQLIDWRRSASSDHLYVREREWEAALTVWLWADMSPSMGFRSHLSQITKRERALVLMLAAAELLVRGGERVAVLGLTTPTASRKATTRILEALVTSIASSAVQKSRPPKTTPSRHSSVLLFGDFLAPIPAIRERLDVLAAAGCTGHLVQILDPAEETLPYEGRTEFYGPSGRERWVADRAESVRTAYRARLEAHRAEVAALATRLGWTFMLHHTDRPASEPLLALITQLHGAAGGYRWQTQTRADSGEGTP